MWVQVAVLTELHQKTNSITRELVFWCVLLLHDSLKEICLFKFSITKIEGKFKKSICIFKFIHKNVKICFIMRGKHSINSIQSYLLSVVGAESVDRFCTFFICC